MNIGRQIEDRCFPHGRQWHNSISMRLRQLCCLFRPMCLVASHIVVVKQARELTAQPHLMWVFLGPGEDQSIVARREFYKLAAWILSQSHQHHQNSIRFHKELARGEHVPENDRAGGFTATDSWWANNLTNGGNNAQLVLELLNRGKCSEALQRAYGVW